MATPAYSRLDVDERRRQLLEAGARVFTERSYEDASMAEKITSVMKLVVRGSRPGRLIQAVRRAGVNNPVLMLDEIERFLSETGAT